MRVSLLFTTRSVEFSRQEPIGHAIVDFYCDELKLAIELDGAGHMDVGGFAADAVRTAALQKRGITVTRFANEELLLNPAIVVSRLERLIASLRGTGDPHP